MWPRMAEKSQSASSESKREQFCTCVVDGWEKAATFPRLMLTFMMIGNETLKKTDSEAQKLINPVANCGVKSGLLDEKPEKSKD